MKHLIMIITVLTLTACGKDPSPVTNTPQTQAKTEIPTVASPSATPAPQSTPTPQPSVTPTPTSTPACASFNNTVWVSRSTGMVDKFDNKVGTFTITFMGLGCVRTMSQGKPSSAGADPLSLVWTTGTGTGCGAVPSWIQFDDSKCNQLTVLFRNGSGAIMETAVYDAQ